MLWIVTVQQYQKTKLIAYILCTTSRIQILETMELSLGNVWILSHMLKTFNVLWVSLECVLCQCRLSHFYHICLQTVRLTRQNIGNMCCWMFQSFSVPWFLFIKSAGSKDALERTSFERRSNQENAISASQILDVHRIPSSVGITNICSLYHY
jgi:hypothetical protein